MIEKGIPTTVTSRTNVPRWPNSSKATIGHRICAQDLIDKRVDCSSRHLTEVPQDLYPDVHMLNLWDNNLITVRNVSFRFYLYLEEIRLQMANVHYIESNTFRLLKNLKYLVLYNNPGIHFSMDVIQWSSELISLELFDCRLTFIDFRILNFLPKLDKIDLSMNEINSISGESQNTALMTNSVSTFLPKHTQEKFTESKFIAKIILDDNPIQMVDPGAVAAMPGKTLSLEGHPLSIELVKNISLGVSKGGIKSLSMESSGIENITSDMFEPLRNTSLAYLSLSKNQLILYPYVFANLRLLFELDLTQCGLTSLEPEYFYGMSSLRKISLIDNVFYSLNPHNATWDINMNEMYLVVSYVEEINEITFQGLDDLTTLTLVYVEEPKSSCIILIEPTKLENFTLMSNFLHIVILKTPRLKFFSGQILTSFYTPRTIYDFRHSLSIERLYLVDNAFNYNSEQLQLIRYLRNLSILNLSYNIIYYVDPHTFRNMSTLKSLHLNNNGIRTIYSSAFEGLVNLTMLNLKDNLITRLPDNFLKDMKVLTSLQLSSNDLSYLHDGLFAKTKMLANLTLANNRFVGFNQTTFDSVYPSLKSVDISGNVLVCNCEGKWMIEKLGGFLINKDHTICSTTLDTLAPLRGKPIGMFNPKDHCGLNITMIFFIVSTGLALLCLLAVSYHHRWLLKYKCFLLKLAILGYREIQDGRERGCFEYDINVMFMDGNKDFAEETFRPALEEMLPNYGRIAFGDDELILGKHYFDAVYCNVENSFKTVLLLSRAAVQDHIFMTKLRIAMNHVTDTETDNLIMVFIEDFPDQELPHLVRLHLSGQGAYLSWEENEDGREYFWNKLKKHMNVNLKVNHMIPPD